MKIIESHGYKFTVSDEKIEEGDYFICTKIENPKPWLCKGVSETCGYKYSYAVNMWTNTKKGYSKIISSPINI